MTTYMDDDGEVTMYVIIDGFSQVHNVNSGTVRGSFWSLRLTQKEISHRDMYRCMTTF